MSSDSGSNSGSERSVSPDQQLSARTPGYNLEGSRSNSPNLQKNNEIDNASGRSRSQSRSRESSKSRSRSNSGASNRSWHSQRSHSEGSHHSDRSKSPSDGSRRSRSRSVGSNLSEKSRSHMSRSGSSRSRSKTPVSVRSRSKTPASNRSRSKTPGSHRSRSKTPGSHRSRSKTPASNRSRSKTPTSIRSRSKTPASIRSHSKSPASNRSRSKTPASNRSRSHSKSGSVRSARSGSGDSNRSRSGDSHKSRSRSRSGESNKSRSRSRSVESQRSSAASNRSRSKSRSRSVSRSVSRSRSKSKSRSRSKSKDRSRSRSKSRSKSRSRSKSKDRSKSSSKSRSKSRSRSRSASVQKGEKIDGSIHSSGDEAKQKVYKRSKILDSDSDEGDNEKVEASAAALFGDADDISSEEEQQQQQQEEDIPDERRSDDEREARSDGENDQQVAVIEEEQEKEVEEPIPETRIDVEIPKISCDLGRDIHFVKLPNFLSVETRPFDPETYEDEIDEEETLDEEGRARLKLKVENTIRWKEELDKSGNLIKQSNARFVRWSDGSLSLHLGSEIFDVYKQPLQGDHNHLFIRQGTGLQGQAVFRTKLSFRPHSTESFTHRKMTLSLADRSQKTPGIKILSQVGLDPDQDRKTLLKKEEEKLRPVKAKPKKRGEGSVGRSHASNTTYREEEGSDEDGAISLNAIKNKYKGGQAPNKGGAIYSSDEEGSDIEARRARKLDKAKVLKDSESSDESE